MHNFYQEKNSKVQKSVFSGIPGACFRFAVRRAPFGPERKPRTCAPCLHALPGSQAFVVVILPQTIKRALIPVT